MPKMQACDMPLHGLNAFDADLFYQAPVQQLRFSTRHRACFSCPRNGHRQHPVKVDMTDGQVASLAISLVVKIVVVAIVFMLNL
jgi:hypothetical protein